MEAHWTLRRLLALGLLWCGSFGAAIDGHAAEADKSEEGEAERVFEEATKQYNLGNFQVALKGYQKAYDLLPLPAFLFNIGQCYRNLGQYDRATFSFEIYLKELKEPAARRRIEALIQELKMEAATKSKVTRAPPVDPPGLTPKTVVTPPPKRGVHKRWWFWVIIAGAALTPGAVLAGVATTSGGSEPLPMGPDATIRYR